MSAVLVAHELLAHAATFAALTETSHAAVFAGTVAANGSNNNTGMFALLLAGPAGGIGFYLLTFRRYRNTDKSDQFERETRVAAQPVQHSDTKVNSLKGTRKRNIDGRNERSFRQRVTRLPPRT